jgi:uncharacterized membrane protein YphA (DoxX/SURF4 family)
VRHRVTAWLTREASTRTAALLRVGLVLLLWDRWADDFVLFRAKTAEDVVVALSFYLSTALLAAGIATRLTSAWVALTMLTVFYWLGVHRGVEPYTHHHTYLLTMLAVLVAFLPSGRSFSVDRWFALHRGRALPERAPMWSLKLVAVQISTLYFWTAWDKTSAVFLSGERLQHIFIERYGSSDPVGIPYFAELCMVSAWFVTALEWLLAIGLWVPRLRVPLVVVGLVFHGVLYMTLPVGPFSATMALMYLAFFDPDAVSGGIDRLLGHQPVSERAASSGPTTLSGSSVS